MTQYSLGKFQVIYTTFKMEDTLMPVHLTNSTSSVCLNQECIKHYNHDIKTLSPKFFRSRVNIILVVLLRKHKIVNEFLCRI